MKKRIVLLGSTGSIGKQTLAVCRRLKLTVEAMSCHKSIDLFFEQIKEFRPKKVAVVDAEKADNLKALLLHNEQLKNTEVLSGLEGVAELATLPCDSVVMAIIGFAAIQPMISAIKAKQKIAMANKEAIVATGKFILDLAKQYGVKIYPVDSEPSAIWQSHLENPNPISKVILTASGGPFRNTSLEEFEKITVADALNHPVWAMGTKITIDSATMMNKGLELIEISRLFNLDASQVEVVVHPQGIVHSAVEYTDGAVIAQMGMPDMELPIQFAITYPERKPMPDKPSLHLTQLRDLEFFEPDLKKFRALALAFEAQSQGGYMPAILNAANEIAVDSFVNETIKFIDIPSIVERTMNQSMLEYKAPPKSIEDILEADLWAREYAKKLVRINRR